VITNAPSSAFDLGGCSQATGCVRREARATAVRALDWTLQERTSLSGLTVVTAATRTTFHVPPGGRNDAEASGGAASAPPAMSVAIATRTTEA
jgi:hypothetical protein